MTGFSTVEAFYRFGGDGNTVINSTIDAIYVVWYSDIDCNDDMDLSSRGHDM